MQIPDRLGNPLLLSIIYCWKIELMDFKIKIQNQFCFTIPFQRTQFTCNRNSQSIGFILSTFS